jgi:hypothetical protein
MANELVRWDDTSATEAVYGISTKSPCTARHEGRPQEECISQSLQVHCALYNVTTDVNRRQHRHENPDAMTMISRPEANLCIEAREKQTACPATSGGETEPDRDFLAHTLRSM